MALFLNDFLFDAALLPFPEETKFDYVALCHVANEIHHITPKNIDDHLPLISLEIWSNIAGKHLGLTVLQSKVYFETFLTLFVDSMKHNDTHFQHQQDNGSLSPSSKESASAKPRSDTKSIKTIPALFLILLLFNQLHKQPSLTDSILKGDDYPRRVLHAHHPLSYFGHNYRKFATNKRTTDDWDTRASSSGNVTPILSQDCPSPRSHASTPTTPIASNGLGGTHADAFAFHPSQNSNNNNNLSESFTNQIHYQNHSTSAGLCSSSSNQISNISYTNGPILQPHIAFSRFPTYVTEGRHQLAAFWRSSGEKWLYLIYVLYKGNSIDQISLHAHMSDHSNAADMTRHGLTEALELESSWLVNAFQFLFTTVTTRHEKIGDKLKKKFADWVKMDHESFVNSNMTDDTVDLIPDDLSQLLGYEESQSEMVFTSESAMHVLWDLISSLPHPFSEHVHILTNKMSTHKATDGRKVQAFSVSIELMNHWISWAVMERPLYLRILRLTDHGIVYGFEESHRWFEDPHETPQILLARKRHQMIVIDRHYVEGANLFIHRCHDAQIYILGAVRNVFISRCRNVTVIAPAISQQLRITQCDHASISAVCRQLLVFPSLTMDDSPSVSNHVGNINNNNNNNINVSNTTTTTTTNHIMSQYNLNAPMTHFADQNNKVYTHTLCHPIIFYHDSRLKPTHEHGDQLASFDTRQFNATNRSSLTISDIKHILPHVIFAPFNTWYDGMSHDLKRIGISLNNNNNKWDQPFIAWSGIASPDVSREQGLQSPSIYQTITKELKSIYATKYQHVFGLLPPSMFFISPVPFGRLAFNTDEQKTYHPWQDINHHHPKHSIQLTGRSSSSSEEDFDMHESNDHIKKPRKSETSSPEHENENDCNDGCKTPYHQQRWGINTNTNAFGIVMHHDKEILTPGNKSIPLPDSSKLKDNLKSDIPLRNHETDHVLQRHESDMTIVTENIDSHHHGLKIDDDKDQETNTTISNKLNSLSERNEQQQLVLNGLPKVYQDWLTSLDPILTKAQSIMSSINGTQTVNAFDMKLSLQGYISNEFQSWLKSTGRLTPLVNLLSAETDVEKLLSQTRMVSTPSSGHVRRYYPTNEQSIHDMISNTIEHDIKMDG